MSQAVHFATDGLSVVSCLDESKARQLATELEPLAPSTLRERRGGVRNLLERSPAVRALAQSSPLRDLVEPILGPNARAVRGILFDKTPEANWKVIWHQDLTIAVQAQHEVEGFGPWSLKDGVTCVQPPLDVLEHMVAVRVHLDDCGPTNGPLRVIAGSHRHGRLGAEAIELIRRESCERVITAHVGEAILMRPLLLHASSPAESPGRRRVVHLEFCAKELPSPLAWHERI